VFVLLIASVCLVLVLACANIGGLLLIRMTTRAREMAIRTAIGAGRSRLAQQLLTETVLITLVGGAFGILLADFGLRVVEEDGPGMHGWTVVCDSNHRRRFLRSIQSALATSTLVFGS
jgi:predicted lysophospholipase L1 biosynthesis ABC-type transport system permease subunit